MLGRGGWNGGGGSIRGMNRGGWNSGGEREDRGAGGPILRDPKANRPQPYRNSFNAKSQQNFGNRKFNGPRHANPNNSGFNNNNFNNSSMFPSTHSESVFPPAYSQPPPPPPPQAFTQPSPSPFNQQFLLPFPQPPQPLFPQQSPAPLGFAQEPESFSQSFLQKPPPPPPPVPLMNLPIPEPRGIGSSEDTPFFQQISDHVPPDRFSSKIFSGLQQERFNNQPPPPPTSSQYITSGSPRDDNNSSSLFKMAGYLPASNFQHSDGVPMQGNNRNNSNFQLQNTFSNNFNEPQRQSRQPPRAGQFPKPDVVAGCNNDYMARNRNEPLLPTPKLIPYPPPPLPGPTSILRNPRGILKPGPYTNNFVKEGKPEDDEAFSHSTTATKSIGSISTQKTSLTVVPYGEGDEDDDEEDDTELLYMGDAGNSGQTEESHDFFSNKMVKHFASILNGKSLEDQLPELRDHLILPGAFLASRVAIVRNLHAMLQDTFTKSSLHPYGADFIGIGNSDDSVNIFINLTGKQGASPQPESITIEPSELSGEHVEHLLNVIQEDKNHKFFGQIVRRTTFSQNRANVPVISFIHSDSQVRCNLRLDNFLLVQEARYIQFICSLDERIITIMALARYWSSVHRVLDTPEEDTKNRFLNLLVLFFLSRKKIIPTMAELQSLGVKQEYFENLNITFCDDHSFVPRKENPALKDKELFALSTLSLLKEFFSLFATAKLDEDVVSLWKAEFIPKEHFNPSIEAKVLPPDLRKRYRYGANGKLRDRRLDCSSKFCIQDFQDLTENLTLAVAEYDVRKFQLECDIAQRKLENILGSGSGNLMDLFVINDYQTFGTEDHKTMHELVYWLDRISDLGKMDNLKV